jgi:predicted ATPase
MQINHIKIKNFKSLKNVDVKFNNLTLITGVNSSGKSSFIQSLLFFRENRENILAINQFKGRSYSASFNGKYIKLGEEALLFSQNTFNEDIMFELVAELDNIKISINKKQEISLISDSKKLDISKLLTDLFSDHCFHYLSTERASPNYTFGFSQQDINLNSIGVNGEYTAHYLAENRHKSLDIEALKHPESQTLQLLENTYKWLGEISSGISISASADASTQSAKLTYQYEYLQ